VHELCDLDSLHQAMGWTKQPVLTGFPHLNDYVTIEDSNHRRWHDAEVVAAAMANECHIRALEIGTGLGLMTSVMAMNAPQAEIVTLNIPPEAGAGAGKLVTMLPERERIGMDWRQRNLGNVRQVLADSLSWKPDCGPIDVAFIDGCHDRDAVISDTRLALSLLRPGGIVAWHDFAPGQAHRYDWIDQVCLAIEELCRTRAVGGPILMLRDSWTALYRKP
jgi:hypothetical protein